MKHNQLKTAVHAVVYGDFDGAVTAFRANQSTENWKELTQAMYALQGLNGPQAEKHIERLADISVAHWTYYIADAHQGVKS